METREELWHRYVCDYDIEVPESAIEHELAYIRLDMKHRMQYDHLTGGDMHLFPERELEEQAGELRAAAVFEAKAPLVLKAIIAEQGFTASREELRAEGEAIAQREGSSIELVQRFFGDDFALLERDVLEGKAMNWACDQAR